MIKVLFHSPINFTDHDDLEINPIGLSYIKSCCESRFPVEIKMVGFIDDSVLVRERPDIVGLSCYAATYNKVKALAALCRKRGVRVVVGGAQISALPELITEDMDVGVLGEGEYTFLDLLQSYDQGWPPDALKKIDGIAFRDETGRLVRTRPRDPIASLDDMPIPDILEGLRWKDTLYLMSSRGCPYDCVFCGTEWHHHVRWLSARRVMETIEFHLGRYSGIRRVFFWDDLFTVNVRRVEEIADLVEARGLNRRLSFIIATRADHINERIVKLLKRMNCRIVSMGMESGCDRTLQYINKRYPTETNRKAAFLLKKYGIHCETSFIIGFPHETPEEIRETYHFVKSIPISKLQVFIPMVYPGTRLWEYAQGRGLVSPQMDWESVDQFATEFNPEGVLSKAIVVSEKLSRRELYDWLVRFRKLRRGIALRYAFRLALRDPVVIFNRLKKEFFYFVSNCRVGMGPKRAAVGTVMSFAQDRP